jgi:hypothetical protein
MKDNQEGTPNVTIVSFNLLVFSTPTNNRVVKITHFQFQGGLMNNLAHNALSYFRPLLGGNSPISSGVVLMKNKCYNGVSRVLKWFA